MRATWIQTHGPHSNFTGSQPGSSMPLSLHTRTLCGLRVLCASVVSLRSRALKPWLALGTLVACSSPGPETVKLPEHQAQRGDEPPVLVNRVSPVTYPSALLARGIEGKVVLRLFVDTLGRLSPDSTRLAESSGYPAMDSAALAAVAEFRFAPALRNGVPVAAAFLQPVHFRHPQAGGTTP